jgi:ComF family protein
MAEPEPLDAEFFCVSCRTPFLNSFPLDSEGRCALCRSGLRAFDAAYSFGSYGGALRRLIHLLKYSRIRTLAAPLSAYLIRSLPRDEAFDYIVPVPLHWRRQWHRGFNQADLLARALSRSTGIPVSRALRRVKAGAAQAGLSNTARRRNVSQAFRCRAGEALRGKRILLLDDVMTTGSTAAACARSLKGAGASRVALLTLARADRRLAVRRVGGVNSKVGGNVRNGE